jgi:hypothetical protein
VEAAVGVDADGRAEVDRRAVEHAAANQPAGRVAVPKAEEIAVHAGDGSL